MRDVCTSVPETSITSQASGKKRSPGQQVAERTALRMFGPCKLSASEGKQVAADPGRASAPNLHNMRVWRNKNFLVPFLTKVTQVLLVSVVLPKNSAAADRFFMVFSSDLR